MQGDYRLEAVRRGGNQAADFFWRVNLNGIGGLGFDLFRLRDGILPACDVSPRFGKLEKGAGGVSEIADGARGGVHPVKPLLNVGGRHRVHVHGKFVGHFCQPVFQVLNVTCARLAVRFQFNQFVGNFAHGARRAFGGVAPDEIGCGFNDLVRAENLDGFAVVRDDQFKRRVQSGCPEQFHRPAIGCRFPAVHLRGDDVARG